MNTQAKNTNEICGENKLNPLTPLHLQSLLHLCLHFCPAAFHFFMPRMRLYLWMFISPPCLNMTTSENCQNTTMKRQHQICSGTCVASQSSHWGCTGPDTSANLHLVQPAGPYLSWPSGHRHPRRDKVNKGNGGLMDETHCRFGFKTNN